MADEPPAASLDRETHYQYRCCICSAKPNRVRSPCDLDLDRPSGSLWLVGNSRESIQSPRPATRNADLGLPNSLGLVAVVGYPLKKVSRGQPKLRQHRNGLPGDGEDRGQRANRPEGSEMRLSLSASRSLLYSPELSVIEGASRPCGPKFPMNPGARPVLRSTCMPRSSANIASLARRGLTTPGTPPCTSTHGA